MKSTKEPSSILRKAILFLILLLPGVLFFSYYPIIRLGSNQTMNFELSLPLIWLVIFDFLSFIALFLQNPNRSQSTKNLQSADKLQSKKSLQNTKNPQSIARSSLLSLKKLFTTNFTGISDRRFFLLSLFPFYATISAFWSPNPLRAILTAGIIWLLFFAIFSLIYILPLLTPTKNFSRLLLKSFFLFSVLVCLFCWIQCFLDLAGIGRESSLLCLGCISQSFGFPHPSGFAIEPQFMGNLLLAPTLTALYLLVSPCHHSSKRTTALLILITFFFSSTLFLTFSRGAIYAYAIALFAFFCFLLYRRRFARPILTLILIPVLSFLFTLTVQGFFTVIGPTHDSFLSGAAKSLHQLSLGLIDLRPRSSTQPDTDPTENPPESSGSSDSTSADSAIFDGYVAESTNIRLNLTSTTIDTWLDTPASILFGVGLGGAGSAMHARFPDRVTSPKEIVQNQFFSLLLELGLIGIIIIIFVLIVAFSPLPLRHSNRPPKSLFWSNPALPLLISLILAYLVTLNFFAGLPNALHIYLLPPLLLIIFASPKHSLRP